MSETAPRSGLEPFAAALYCGVLLFCWLIGGELLRLVLGDRPRLMLTLAQVLALLVPALVLTRAFASVGLAPRTSRRPPPAPAALALALPGLAVGGFLLGTAIHHAWLRALVATGWEWVDRLDRIVTESYAVLLRADSPAELVAVLLMVSLVPAVCEEVAFRRGLQGLLAARGSGASAVIVSAAVFSAFHLDPFGLPARFVLGISLGVLYHRTGALWTAGLLHALHNFAIVLGLWLVGDQAFSESSSLQALDDVSPGLLVALGLAGLTIWLASLQALAPRAEPEAEAAAAESGAS